MHGMLSLWILVAAFAGLVGWAGYVSVRLYRTGPATDPFAAIDGRLATATAPVAQPGEAAMTDPGRAPASRPGNSAPELAESVVLIQKPGPADHDEAPNPNPVA